MNILSDLTDKVSGLVFDHSSDEDDDSKKKVSRQEGEKKESSKAPKAVKKGPKRTKKASESKGDKSKTMSTGDVADDASSDFLSLDSDVELGGEIAADVFTGGLYGIVTEAVEAHDEYEKKKALKKSCGQDDDDDLSDEVQLAGEIAANVLTGGIYGGIKGVAEAVEQQQNGAAKDQEKAGAR